MADAKEGPKQEFVASMGAILRAGPDRIVTPDGYRKFAEIKECDRTAHEAAIATEPDTHLGVVPQVVYPRRITGLPLEPARARFFPRGRHRVAVRRIAWARNCGYYLFNYCDGCWIVNGKFPTDFGTLLTDAVIFSVDMKAVQMDIVPAHGDLNDMMQLSQRDISTYPQPATDHWADTAKGNFDRIGIH